MFRVLLEPSRCRCSSYLFSESLNKKWIVDIWFWTGFGALNPYNEESRNSSLRSQDLFQLQLAPNNSCIKKLRIYGGSWQLFVVVMTSFPNWYHSNLNGSCHDSPYIPTELFGANCTMFCFQWQPVPFCEWAQWGFCFALNCSRNRVTISFMIKVDWTNFLY